jgi:hypothetical protein
MRYTTPTAAGPSEQPSPALKCPFCGSSQARLSARQSHKRPVSIFRCQKCKRHFEQDAPNTNRAITKVQIAIGALIVVVLGVIVAISVNSETDHIGTPIPTGVDLNAPAPVEGTDMVSQYHRGLYFWARGDYLKAFPPLKSAAQMGHREASYYLGLAYLYGHATVQNYRLAFEQIQTSARQNYLNAQHQLGIMYRDGLGTPTNREQAYIWLNIAASRGQEEASHDRDKMAMIMSADEIARAQDATMKELANLRGEASPKAPAPDPAAATTQTAP